MGIGGRGFAGGLALGVSAASRGLQTYWEAKDREEADKQKAQLGEIAAAMPAETQGFTAEQGDQLRAAGDSGQYDIGTKTKDDGTFDGYTVTPKADPSQVGVVGPQPVTDFLGKRTEGRLNEAQQMSARNVAMAGVVAKTNPAEAMRLQQQNQQSQHAAQQGVLTDLQIKGAQRQNLREDRADEHTAAIQAVDNDVADWAKKRLTNPDGTQRDMTLDDQLSVGQYRASKLVAAGRLPEANAMAKENMAFAANKIQLQTAERNEALAQASAAVASGDLSKIAPFYDKFVPDGAKVKSITKDPTTGKITIQRETVDGRAAPPVTFKDSNELLAGLQVLKDPMALYNHSQSEFHRLLQTKADTRAEAATGAAVGLHKAQTGEITQKTEDRKELSTLHDTLGAAIDSGDKAAADKARTKLLAYSVSGKSAQMSDIERRANFFLASGAAKNIAEAATLAHQKPQTSPKDDYIKMTTGAMPLTGDTLAKAMETMYGSNWESKVRGDGGPSKPSTLADAHAQAKSALAGGASPAAVNQRLKDWGYPALN